jgi:aryl-alcohol dehydrogenase-like predicted oxidoreductase
VIKRLAIGTAQFGQEYGIANRGRVTLDQAQSILEVAASAGIDTLDTAMAYGDCEAWLGEIGVARWQVVSKLPAVDEACKDVAGWAQECLHRSLETLGIPRLHALLLHSPGELLGPQGDALFSALNRIREHGLTNKIGVSVYGPSELELFVDRFDFDIIQAPFNVVDRRLLRSGLLTQLKRSSVEIHTRSAFLQGLLLMNVASLPPAFSRWQPLWERWNEWLAKQRVTAVEATVSFALSRPEIDRVIVGIDCPQHLDDILAAARVPIALAFPSDFESTELALIDPSQWDSNEKMQQV